MVSKILFSSLRASVWSKDKGGRAAPPGLAPGSATAMCHTRNGVSF